MRDRWNAAADRLGSLPPSPDLARDAPIARTLRLRRDIAVRDYAAFQGRWAEGGIILPDWERPLARIAERLGAPGFPDRARRKVFGIGLSKTGTTSLASALDILGWQTAHFPQSDYQCDYRGCGFRPVRCAERRPRLGLFESLYAAYPNALFVCTERPLESWEASVRGHRIRTRGTDEPPDLDRIAAVEGPDSPWTARLPIHDLIWRQPDLASVHAHWAARVEAFFADKPGKLLRFSVFEGHGWAELCGFLDLPLPEQAFPHANKGD